MELDNKLSSLFVDLCKSLSEENVQTIDFSLRVNLGHRWPALEPLTAQALFLKMMELGMWKVDLQRRECHLAYVIDQLDIIGRKDLSVAVKDYGQ